MSDALRTPATPATGAPTRAGRGGSRAAGAAWLVAGFCVTLPLTVQLFRYGDEWWHIALGRLILSHGIPGVEPFSFVATQHPWVEQQWLYEVILAGLVRLGGDGLASLALGLVGSLALLAAALAVPRGARISRGWAAAAMVLGGLMAGMALGVRAETVSALGVAATLLIVRRWRDGSRWAVWLLPPMYLLWANLHAGFIAGLAVLAFTLLIHRPTGRRPAALSGNLSLAVIVVGAAAAAVLLGLVAGAVVLALLWGLLRPVPLDPGARRRPLAIASLGAAALTLVNPAGPGLYGYIVETLGNPLLSQLVSEWQSPNFHDLLTRLIEVVAALLVLVWLLGRRPRVPDLLLATAAFLFTLQAVRNVSLFAVVAIPLLAEYGQTAWSATAPERWRRRLGTRLPTVLAVAAALAVSAASIAVTLPQVSASSAAHFEQTHEPETAADYVAAHFPGQRLLSSDGDAGYLAYRFPTGRVVFVYDEIGIFGTGPLHDYIEVATVSGSWKAVLSEFHIHHAVLSATGADTSALLELGWTVNCYDAASGRVVISAGASPPTATPPPPSAAPAC
ncbi:MAG: hypothetical protein ACLQT7_02470 [Candidatus Dormibacteria bacterium]